MFDNLLLITTAALAGLLILALATKHIKGVILFLILYLPFEGFLLKFIPASLALYLRYLPELILYASFVKYFFPYIIKRVNLPRSGLEFAFTGLGVVACTGLLLQGGSLIMALLEGRLYFRYVVLIYIFLMLNNDEHYSIQCLDLILITGFIQAIIGLGQSIGGSSVYDFFSPGTFEIYGGQKVGATIQEFGQVYIRGTFGRYTIFGQYMAMCSLLSIVFLLHHSNYKRRFIRLTLFCCLIGLILSASRGSYIVFAGGFIMIIYQQITKFRRKKILKIFIFSFVCLSVLFRLISYNEQASTVIISRWEKLLSKDYQIGNQGAFYGRYVHTRMSVVRTVPAAMAQHPMLFFFGAGPGFIFNPVARDKLIVGKLGLPYALHSNDVFWVQMMMSFGVVGIFFILLILVKIYKISESIIVLNNSKSNEKQNTIMMSARVFIVIAVIANIFSPFFHIRETSFLFWVISAMAVNLRSGSRNLNKPISGETVTS